MTLDISPEAVTRRLEQASHLRDLCLELGRARPLSVGPGAGNGSAVPGSRENSQELGDEEQNTRKRK